MTINVQADRGVPAAGGNDVLLSALLYSNAYQVSCPHTSVYATTAQGLVIHPTDFGKKHYYLSGSTGR